MPWFLKYPIRAIQSAIAKSTDDCAHYMIDPILQSRDGKDLIERPGSGVYIMKEDATPGPLTKLHTTDAIDSVWNTTKTVLERCNIKLE